MKDLSVVIAHRGDGLGLWATVTSVADQLQRTGLSYEFCLCVNGEGKTPGLLRRPKHSIAADTSRVIEFLDKAGTLGYAKILQKDLAPPTARQLASERATGRHIFFLDNHCLLAPKYFENALRAFSATGADMVHSATQFNHSDFITYHYQLKLRTNFWAESALTPHRQEAHQIATAGHGGFAVTAQSWRDVGGYWKGFEGYAGEELTTDLQYWMRGRTVVMEPSMLHYHWAGRRAYARHFTDDFYKNLMMSAHIIGGQDSLWKVFNHFTTCTKQANDKTMYGLLEDAYYHSLDEANRLAACRTMDLTQLLSYFQAHDIPY